MKLYIASRLNIHNACTEEYFFVQKQNAEKYIAEHDSDPDGDFAGWMIIETKTNDEYNQKYYIKNE